MPLGWVAGATVVGGAMASNAAENAADTQAAAADRAAELQYKQWTEQKALMEQQYNQQRADIEPWRKAGEQALNQLIPLASNYTPFGMDQFKADPGYQFRLQEGLKQLQGRAAARGGALSGATLKGVQQYGQGLASEEYQNAFNRYQTERAARLNPLQSLAGVGQSAAGQQLQSSQNYASGMGAAGQNYANNAGEAYMGAANARASGYVGQANALNSAIGNIGNMFMMNKYMTNQPTGGYGGYGGGYGRGYGIGSPGVSSTGGYGSMFTSAAPGEIIKL
jgi:hypothetical protein